MLRRAYFDGRLDFKKRTDFSNRREELILREVERDLLSEVYHLRTLVDTILVSGLSDKKVALKYSEAGYNNYLQLQLPYLAKHNKIIGKDSEKSDMEFFKKALAEHRKKQNAG